MLTTRRNVRTVLAAALVGAVALPPSAATAQQVVIPDRGTVIDGARGSADELALTPAEAARAFSASTGLTVGIVLPAPDAIPEEMDVGEIVDALTATVTPPGARVVTCDGAGTGAAACIDRFVDDNAAAVVLIGSHGDQVAPTARAVAKGLTVPISIGDTQVAPGSVVIDGDPIMRAYEQGRVGGGSKGVPQARGKRSAVIASAVPPGEPDPATDAMVLGLQDVAPRVKVMAVLGPPAIETTEDLAAAVAQLPPSGILIGENVLLTQATAEGLDALPASLRVVAWRCTPSVMALIDLGSRIRACLARSNEGAGVAAGNAILGLLIGRDVPGLVDAPLYAHRGTVAVGPGHVQLGRRSLGEHLAVTDAERAAAAAALQGRVVALVTAASPGEDEPSRTAATRSAIEAGLTALGATPVLCVHDGDTELAAACIDDQVAAGVAAIVVLGDSVDLVLPATAAIRAGIPVFGSDAAFLGDTGAVYVDLDPRAVGRLQGRMAAAYATAAWPDYTVAHAATLNDTGPAGRDPVVDAIERTASLSNPNVVPVGRFKASRTSARAGVVAALRQVPDLRLLLGPHAARATQDLDGLRRPAVPRDLVAFGLLCTDRLKRRIDEGGRLKGCVDVDPAAAGGLLVDVVARVFAGGTVPGLIDVTMAPYPGAPAESPASPGSA